MYLGNAATPWVRTLGKAALLFIAYFLSACLAITLSRNIGSVAVIWPATAVAVGVLLISPARGWPAYLAAAGAANLAAGIAPAVPAGLSIGFTTLNVMEILLAAGLLRRLRAQADWLGSVGSLMRFLGIAAILAPTATAMLRSALIHFAQHVPYWSAWETRWIADIVGTLIVAPLLLAWSRREPRAPGVRRPALEIAGIAAGLVAATALTVVNWGGSQGINHVALVLAVPFQIWATLRFGSRGATTANAVVALVGIGALLTGAGPQASPTNIADALLTLQTLLATTAVTTLVLVAALRERRAAEVRLRDAVESIGEGFALFDANDRLVLSNSMHQRMYAKNNDLMVPGVRFEEILRGSVARGQHPDAVDREDEWIKARLQRHLDPGDPIEQDRGDGQWLLICERRTSEGGIVGTWTDISRLKAQEAALIASEQRMRVAESRARAAEARLRDAIESMNEGLTAYDAQGRMVLTNRRMREIYPMLADLLTPGARFEDFLREGVARGVFDTGGAPTEIFVADHMNLPADHRKEIEIDLTDGRWLLVSRQRTSDGGTVHVRTDITRLKQHEQALRESEERLRGMLRELEESHAQLERQSFQLTRRQPGRRAAADGRGRQRGEVPVPGQHQPRAAHPAQRHPRLLGDHEIGDVRAAGLAAISRLCRRHPRQRQPSADGDQRHPRPLEDRGREVRAERGGLRRSASRARRRPLRRRARRQRRPRVAAATGARPAGGPRRRPADQADPAQPALQCHQVLAGRRHGHRGRRNRP